MKLKSNPFGCCCFGFMIFWVLGVITLAIGLWRQEDKRSAIDDSISTHLATAQGTITSAWLGTRRRSYGRTINYEFTDASGRKIVGGLSVNQDDLPKIGIDSYDQHLLLSDIPVEIEYDSSNPKNSRIKGFNYTNSSKSSKWVGLGMAVLMLSVFTAVFIAPMWKILRNKRKPELEVNVVSPRNVRHL